jgi:hypothetical protein
MALTVAGIQGSHSYLGPGLQWKKYLLTPGTSDYTTGGYAITATQLGFLPTYGIQSAWVSLANATAAATWNVIPLVTFVQIGGVATGAGTEGYTQILLYVYVLATGAQVSSGGSLSGSVWQLEVIGQ